MMKISKTISPQDNHSSLPLNFAAGLMLFLNCFLGAYVFSVDSPNIDFFTWWAVPHGISQEYIETPYSDHARKELAQKITEEIETTRKPNVERRTVEDVLTIYNNRILTTASPFFYTFLNRFVSDNYQMDKRTFAVVSLLCFSFSFFILGRLLNFSYLTLFIFYALISTFYSPYLSELKVGNVNQIQLLFIALFILLSVKAKGFVQFFWAAFFLGISIFLKPNTCFIFFFAMVSALFHQDFKKIIAYAAGFGLSGAVAFISTALFFKSWNFQIWKDWLATIPSTVTGTFSFESGNYSLSKFILDITGHNISLILYAILMMVFIWIVYLNSRSLQRTSLKTHRTMKMEREVNEAFFVTSFGTLTMFIASGLVWGHYYVAIIPLFLFLLRPDSEKNFTSNAHLFTKPLTYTALILSTQFVTRQLTSQEACVVKVNVVALILLVLLIIEMIPRLEKK